MSLTTISTGQCVFPELRPFCWSPKCIFFAEYLQEFSMGHDRKYVASPAAVGFRVLLKYCRAPVELICLGMCAGLVEPVAGEHSSQRSRSMSWQYFVRRQGA